MKKLRTILITGGAGFVGSNLAIFLKKQRSGCRIICLDNLIRRGSELNVQRLKEHGLIFIKGDIRSKKDLLDLETVDLIIECSAEASVSAGYDHPEYMIDTNLLGTLNCLELARRDSSDFIFLSTSRVYPFASLNEIPFCETDTRFDWEGAGAGPGWSAEGINVDFGLNGEKTLYGATKLASEQLITEFSSMYGFRHVINRLGVIAGPWQMGKTDQGIVGHWMACHKYQKSLKYIGFGAEGKQVRDIVHIDDVCDLIGAQIEQIDQLPQNIFNAGGGRDNSCSLSELTARIQSVTQNKMDIGSDSRNRKGDVRIYITDNAQIGKAIGWKPQRGLDKIMEDVYSWMNTQDALIREVFTSEKDFVHL